MITGSSGSIARIAARQPEVEQDDVEALGVDPEEGRFAAALDHHVVVLLDEPFAQRIGHLLFVFDHEDPHDGNSVRFLIRGS